MIRWMNGSRTYTDTKVLRLYLVVLQYSSKECISARIVYVTLTYFSQASTTFWWLLVQQELSTIDLLLSGFHHILVVISTARIVYT